MNVPVWMFVLTFAPICASYKILVISPLPSKSHNILSDAYANLLLEAGREVTYITAMPKTNTHPLLHDVDVSDNTKYFPFGTLSIKAILDKEIDVTDSSQFTPIITITCKGTLEHKEVAKPLLDVDQKFDLVIAEWMFNEVYSGITNGHINGIPFPMDTHDPKSCVCIVSVGNWTEQDINIMGSNIDSRDMPFELKNKLINMFSQLKQAVLWKFEEDFPNLPKNDHILKWAPQQSILAHPNCVLFITHGGLLSTTEAVHFGVPLIGIPVFGDQPMNVQGAVNKGFAIKVGLYYDMAEDLYKAIQEVMNNPSYRSKVKELSFIYHHRLSTPQAEFVHWAEHVIKTGGAPHLRSPALTVPWYQKLYLDLLTLLAASLLQFLTI